jgi:methionine sulfoxide reductase catalytic subunit
MEEPLGQRGKVPTVIFNGYGQFVADLYKELEDEPLFM